MPRSRRRNTRRTSPRRSPSRRRRTATKLRLHSTPHGTMPEKTRRLTVSVNVGRNRLATSRDSAFMACATFGKVTECSESHNPSAAIGRAVAKVGGKVADRPSSFAGLGNLAGSRKRRRKSRR